MGQLNLFLTKYPPGVLIIGPRKVPGEGTTWEGVSKKNSVWIFWPANGSMEVTRVTHIRQEKNCCLFDEQIFDLPGPTWTVDNRLQAIVREMVPLSRPPPLRTTSIDVCSLKTTG